MKYILRRYSEYIIRAHTDRRSLFFVLYLYQKCTIFIFQKEDIGPLRTVVAGGCAGVTLWTLIFPADVVKSRLQVNQ